MSKRLNHNRESTLQPKRIKSCYKRLHDLGFEITEVDDIKICFLYNGYTIKFYPYSGWHTGKGIKDGRGFNNLLKQIT